MIIRPVKSVGHVGDIDRAWDLLNEKAIERLKYRMEKYEPPALESWPVQDLVVVYRFPTKATRKMTSGGLWIPDISQKEEMPFSLGLLIGAGPEAMDVLASHGTLLGDVIRFAPLAGDEETEQRVQDAIAQVQQRKGTEEEMSRAALEARDSEMEKKKLLRLQVPFVHESVDLLGRLFGPKPTMEMVRHVDKNGDPQHQIRPIIANLQ
jgi:hypothetical protein